METFDLSKKYILEDDAVLLRPLESSDLGHLAPFSINEPDIWKYSLIQAGGGEAQMQHYISIAMDAKQMQKEYPFIVFDKKQNKYAGSTRFYDIQLENKTLQLGYTWYGKQFQGTGLNKACKYELLNFGFENIQFKRIQFSADLENTKSQRAIEKLGALQEGIFRNNYVDSEGKSKDDVYYSIILEEWKNTKQVYFSEFI